jgi:hypothetical protein
MNRTIKPIWALVAGLVIAAIAVVLYAKSSSQSQGTVDSALQEMSKQKAPGNQPELQPGGIVPGSGMMGPSGKPGR